MRGGILKISLLLFLFVTLVFSQKKIIQNSGANHRTISEQDSSILEINNLQYWFTNSDNVRQWVERTFIPPPKYVMPIILYNDGPILGGLVNDTLRMIGSTYRTCFTPGPIDEGQQHEPDGKKSRIFQIRKDLDTLKNLNDRKKYEDSYNEWPMNLGAPYEFNNSGKMIPKFIGDEEAWWVMNDLSVDACKNFYGTLPFGTEWQCLVWGYGNYGPLSNTIFKKYRIINKGNNNAKKCYFSYWGDPDVGRYAADLAGCDPNLNLGYVYYSMPSDEVYGKKPPTLGITLLQGPVYYTGNIKDEANWNFQKKIKFKNLQMTAFSFYIHESYPESDPTNYILKLRAKDMYNRQKGLRMDGTDWINPFTGKTTPFIASGDPINNIGWIDGDKKEDMFNPGDKRILISSGPFDFLKGDTQEVAISISVGRGADRLSSIWMLKYFSLFAGSIYKSGMHLKMEINPVVKKTETANKVILNWNDDKELYKIIENYNKEGYKFEGYNIYQIPYPDAEKYYRVATFDLKNDITSIFISEYDASSGNFLKRQIQWGSNNGIKREIEIENDIINNRKLINGRKYYFAVTAYAYNPDAPIPAIESIVKIIEVTPQGKKSDLNAITIYPNPYYISGTSETSQYDRYLTFNHLPPKAIIRIFTLSGSLVKTINKNDETQFVKWNLLNERNILIASGMYIAHIEMPELNKKKILKFSVIMDNMIFN